MKKNIFIVFILVACISCNSLTKQGFVKFQTFDEYRLIGINKSDKELYRPCIYVKKSLDTIFVIHSEDPDNILKYINRGDYFYNCTFVKVDAAPDTKSLAELTYYEKFIFNDTIILHEYSYTPPDINNVDWDIIYINTKTEQTIIKKTSKQYSFDELRSYARNYSKLFPIETNNPDSFQQEYYSVFEKKFINDSLFYKQKFKHYQISHESPYFLGKLGEYAISIKGLDCTLEHLPK